MSNFGYSTPEGGTDEELLELTRAAIARITVSGQAYGTDGQSLTRADLGRLWEQVNRLEDRIATAAGNGIVTNHARLTRNP